MKALRWPCAISRAEAGCLDQVQLIAAACTVARRNPRRIREKGRERSGVRLRVDSLVSGIQPLSDALGDLYNEFNALKERLSELTAKFDGVEAFVDDVRSGRKPAPPRGEPRPPGSLPGEAPAAAPPGRRTRVVVRRVKKPAGSW